MGGTALGFQAARLTQEQFERVSSTIVDRLRGTYYKRVELPRPRPGKDSHGDVDILVSDPVQVFDAQRVFGSTKVVRNGPSTSFEYEGHQIDIIHASQMDFARFTYSFGDLAMIIGMIMRSVGLKFGCKGLSIVVHGHKVKLSTDLERVLAFAGLSLEVWKRGFQTDEQVFAYITSSRLFRPSMFKLREDREQRQALVKRPMFVAFVEYVRLLPDQEKLTRELVQNEAIACFDRRSEIDKLSSEIERARKLKERFNGKLVMEITGLKNKELGAFMSKCRQRITDDELLEMEDIRSFVVEMQNN